MCAKKMMPQEVEVWYVLPAIRREFVKVMVGKGMSQKEVAGKIGLTEAAVSQYVRAKRAGEVKFSQEMLEEMEKSVERILAGGSVVEEVHRISLLCRKNKTLCDIHRSRETVPNGCRICLS